METILAIDLGRFNSVCCWYGGSVAGATFRTVKSTPADLQRQLQRQPVQRVVIEACSQSGWVHDLCESLGLRCDVASTTGPAWQWKRIKRKTDRDDALKLAKLAAVGELDTVRVPNQALRQWKSLIGLRKRWVGERGRGQNRIRGLLVVQGLVPPVGNRAWTAIGLAGLQTLAKSFDECSSDELWRGELSLLLERHRFLEEKIAVMEAKLNALAEHNADVKLLTSIPGVGVRTAEVIAVYLQDAQRFHSADEVSAYAGLVPRQYQSGESDRRGRITKRGPTMLRAALVECAWCSLRYNAWALATWKRLIARGVSRKKAVVALARKLLIRCWAILKHGEVWRMPASA